MSAIGPEIAGLIGWVLLASAIMNGYDSLLLLAIATPLYGLSASLLWSFSPWRVKVTPGSTGGKVVRDEHWGFE